MPAGAFASGPGGTEYSLSAFWRSALLGFPVAGTRYHSGIINVGLLGVRTAQRSSLLPLPSVSHASGSPGSRGSQSSQPTLPGPP